MATPEKTFSCPSPDHNHFCHTMEGPWPRGGQSIPPPERQPKILRCIIFAILLILILVGLALFIAWLAVRPQRLVYSIEDGKVHGFDLQNNHLNASFDFVFESYNPNRKVSLYYDATAVLVTYHDQTIAFDSIEPFYQRRYSVTKFGVKPTAQSVPLDGKVANNLRHEQSSGEIVLEVQLEANIRFKIGIWKSSHSTLTIFCKNVKVHLDSSKAFQRTSCGAHS